MLSFAVKLCYNLGERKRKAEGESGIDSKQQNEKITYQVDWEKKEMQIIDLTMQISEIPLTPVPISPLLYVLRAMSEMGSSCTKEDEHLFLVDAHYKGATLTIHLHRNDFGRMMQAPPEVLEWLLRRTLTPRETQVAILLFEGSTIRSIANQLKIAEGTVKRIIYNIYQKCNVGSQVDLIRYIYRQLAEAQSLICPMEWNPGD